MSTELGRAIRSGQFVGGQVNAVPERPKQIPLMVERLGESLNLLEDSIRALAERLLPVSIPRTIPDRTLAEPKNPEDLCDLALRIRNYSNKILDFNDTITAIRDGVEL